MLANSIVALATVLIPAQLPAVATTPRAGAAQIDYAWDMLCYGNVRPISKKLKVQKGAREIEINDSIKLCTKHLYQYTGKAGQRLAVSIGKSTKTWLIISRKAGSRLVTGEQKWEGALPENGKYVFEIVTTEPETAVYTLRIKFH